MKTFAAVLLGLLVLTPVVLWLSAIGLTIYGLYIAFSASVVLGVIALILEPSPLVLGLVAIFGHSDIAVKIATWLGLSQ